jgi:nitrogen regulatory protein PII
MKLVLAIVEQFRLDDVTRALTAVAGFPGITVSDVRGFGRERAEAPVSRADDEVDYFSAKCRLETVVHDDQVNEVVSAISHAAHTGRYGDGMVFVLPVERAVRIMNLREGEAVV